MTSVKRDKNGKWLDVSGFREAGDNFLRHNERYCLYAKNTSNYYNFWKEERRRCREGYEVNGHKITGDYYFYLNYCPMMRVQVTDHRKKSAKKVNGFPEFWDYDYEYFWYREIARNGILDALKVPEEEQGRILSLSEDDKEIELLKLWKTLGLRVVPAKGQLEGGLDMIIGKARRRGFSYKNAAIAVCNYFHRPNSYTLLMAYESKYLYPGRATIFGKCKEFIAFINDKTAWKMPSESIDRNNHIKASHYEVRDGVSVEVGFLSEIEARSFKDNPDAGRGIDAYDIIGEEVGAWGVPGGLKNTLSAMRSSSEAGIYKTGMITLFGTSGDIEKGTVDFADLHRRPRASNFMAFYDAWGDFPDKVEGFFFPAHCNMEGYYDANGNSDIEGAKQFELNKRNDLINKGATANEIAHRMQETPLNSAEAFSQISRNTFPVLYIQRQLDKVIAMGYQEIKGTPVNMYYEGDKVIAKPILDKSVTPITSFKDIPADIKGCPIIYEYPLEGAQRGLYKIGYDPIRQEQGTSLAAIIVYKGVCPTSFTHDIIVAEYVGRYDDPDDIDRVAEMFADLYNTTIMYENEVTGVKNYFRRIKRLSLLALQPDSVISKNVKHSKVARVYGCHMNEQLKDAAERYVKSWLLEINDYDENGNAITTIDKIYSIRLLEELINYYRKGNFDLISALFMCMFQIQEEKLGAVYYDEEDTPQERKYRDLVNLMDNAYVH